MRHAQHRSGHAAAKEIANTAVLEITGAAIVPLVIVTEGIDCACKRHRTVNAVHVEGYGMDHGAFLENISAFLSEKYGMEQVERIYLHGDDGTRMNRAKDVFLDVIRMRDGSGFANCLI